MVVRLLKSVAGPHGGPKGSTVTVPDRIAKSWIRFKIAEPVKAEKAVSKTATGKAQESEKRDAPQSDKRTGKRTANADRGKKPSARRKRRNG